MVASVDERQITHLICVRLKHLLYDFFRGYFGPPSCCFSYIKNPKHPLKSHMANAWWTFRIFLIFFCSGRGGRESPRRREGGCRFFIENPRKGGGFQEGEGGEGPGGCLRRIGELGGGG